MKVCLECGARCEDGNADFCYNCGSRRVLDIDEKTNTVNLKKGECPYCGHVTAEGSGFCSNCGRRIGRFEYSPVKSKLTGKDYLTLFLAAVPGAVNLFGLGHLVLHKWSRAFMYLVISAVVLYLRYFSGSQSTSSIIFIEIIGIFIYLKQTMEIFNAVFRGEGGN